MVSLFSLLLLSSATLPANAMVGPITDEPAEQVQAPSLPPPTPSPQRDSDDVQRRSTIERAERQPWTSDVTPERVRAERSWSGNRNTEEMLSARRAGRTEPRSIERPQIRDIAAASINEQREEGLSPAARPPRRGDGDAQGWNRRDRSGERRSRNRDVPSAAGSPVFGSAVPSPDTVTQPPRDVSPRAVTGRDLRDRIAAEGLRRDRAASNEWRRDWRQDRRYDWRQHRDRDRARFHLGLYIDPFGWRYRDYEIGWRLPSRYYASRYWLNDPWNYRLPPVGGYLRWVRYHQDVLLVDLRTGRVLDRIPRFFW